MTHLKHLTEAESRSLKNSDGRSSGKYVRDWAELLSSAREELDALKKLYDRAQRDHGFEVAKLEAKLARAEQDREQHQREAEVERIRADDLQIKLDGHDVYHKALAKYLRQSESLDQLIDRICSGAPPEDPLSNPLKGP